MFCINYISAVLIFYWWHCWRRHSTKSRKEVKNE